MSKDSRRFYPVAPRPRNAPITDGQSWRRAEQAAPRGPAPRQAEQAGPVPQSPSNGPIPRDTLAANVAAARERTREAVEARKNSQPTVSSPTNG